MFVITVETPFLRDVMAGLEYTPMDIRVEVAMTFDKTLDELTSDDYMRCKKAWIYYLVKLVHTPGRKAESLRMQQLLKFFSKEIEACFVIPVAPQKRPKGRPRKYPE